MWRALAGLLVLALGPAALACDGVSTCEAECSAGDASACTTLADFAWANPWGLGLQADRLLSPYCTAGVVDACVVLARHRAATVGAGVDALLLEPCSVGELSACAPLIEQGLQGTGDDVVARREALARAAETYSGPDSTVAPVLRVLASGEVGDREAELIDGCKRDGHCHGALSLLGTGRVGLEALDWPRQGVKTPHHSLQERGVPRPGGPDGALGTEVLREGIATLATRCEASPAACFEGLDLALRLKEAYTCDRRVLDCIGLGNRLLDDLCAAGSPVGCRSDELARHWRERDVVAWFEEACSGDDPDLGACEALAYGLRHRDSQPAHQRLAPVCKERGGDACVADESPQSVALPSVVLLTTALSECSSGKADSCVALGATLADDDAETAEAWFEALACRAGDAAACRASWRLQVGDEPARFGDQGRVTQAAETELARRCDADDFAACFQLGGLTRWRDPALTRARGRSADACRGDDLQACLNTAVLAYRVDSAEALSEELEALERRVTRLCGGSGPRQLEACGLWSQLERGFVELPTDRIELEEVSTRLRSIERLTSSAKAQCAADSERCDAVVALIRSVRADACWEHEACPTETETLMREACRGGHALACDLREADDPGLVACAAGDASGCLKSAQWRDWRGLEVMPTPLTPLCEQGVLEACALGSLSAPSTPVCDDAVACDVACRRGDGQACRELAAATDAMRPGEALAVEALSSACFDGYAPACKTWARGLDVHGGGRQLELETALLERCREGDAGSCVWSARFQGRRGIEALGARALADCSQSTPGACAWAAAAAHRLRPGPEAESMSGEVTARLVGSADVDCRAGDRRACNALGLAATGRNLPLPVAWDALEGPLPSNAVDPVTALVLPAELPGRDAWLALAKSSKAACKSNDQEACRDVVAAQTWTLETCTSARCSRKASKALCGLGVSPLCGEGDSAELPSMWAATLQSATVGDARVLSDLRSRCLESGDEASCVVAAVEVIRREVVATPASPDDKAALEVACRSGAAFACRSR